MLLSALMNMHAEQRSPVPTPQASFEMSDDDLLEDVDDDDDDDDDSVEREEQKAEVVDVKGTEKLNNSDSEDEFDKLPLKRSKKKCIFFDDEAGEVLPVKKSTPKKGGGSVATGKASRGKKVAK
jgi:hypothetical protein